VICRYPFAVASLRIATFNVSMEGGNYVERGVTPRGHELPAALSNSDHPQIRNIAEIIQRVRPDILLLNEFDYHPDPERGVRPFLERYLAQAQPGTEPIDYPYFFQGPVNTGVDSGMDLDRDGRASGTGKDAFGYGLYPGQYGMLLLSRFPIDVERIRSFQHFLWKDMPDNLMADMRDEDGELWYPPAIQEKLRLSSKSHWDVPVRIGGRTVCTCSPATRRRRCSTAPRTATGGATTTRSASGWITSPATRRTTSTTTPGAAAACAASASWCSATSTRAWRRVTRDARVSRHCSVTRTCAAA
jgi:hypothetical protein